MAAKFGTVQRLAADLRVLGLIPGREGGPGFPYQSLGKQQSLGSELEDCLRELVWKGFDTLEGENYSDLTGGRSHEEGVLQLLEHEKACRVNERWERERASELAELFPRCSHSEAPQQ